MYCMYKQLHPPSGIEHAVYCNLLSPTEQHLVIATVNVLQVYRLIDDVEASVGCGIIIVFVAMHKSSVYCLFPIKYINNFAGQ